METTPNLAVNSESGDLGNLSDGADFLNWQRAYSAPIATLDSSFNGDSDSIAEPVSSTELATNSLTGLVTFIQQDRLQGGRRLQGDNHLPLADEFWTTYQPTSHEFDSNHLRQITRLPSAIPSPWQLDRIENGTATNLAGLANANQPIDELSSTLTESIGESRESETTDLALAQQEDWLWS